VQKAISTLSYRPNTVARSLRNGRSERIALVTPELDMPYFADLASAVITRARHHGYSVLVDQTSGDLHDELELLEHSGSSLLFDGLIISPQAVRDSDLTHHGLQRPVVLLGDQVGHHGKALPVDQVTYDNLAAACAATEHLMDLGRRRIAVLGDLSHATARLRVQGHQAAHHRRGLPVDPSLVIDAGGYRYHHGTRAAQALLTQCRPAPDALFCCNDQLAIGAMRVLVSHGLRIPEDVAVVGFDDIDVAEHTNPSLTSIALDRTAIAAAAVDRIVDRLHGRVTAGHEVKTVDFSLVLRQSTTGVAPRG